MHFEYFFLERTKLLFSESAISKRVIQHQGNEVQTLKGKKKKNKRGRSQWENVEVTICDVNYFN